MQMDQSHRLDVVEKHSTTIADVEGVVKWEPRKKLEKIERQLMKWTWAIDESANQQLIVMPRVQQRR